MILTELLTVSQQPFDNLPWAIYKLRWLDSEPHNLACQRSLWMSPYEFMTRLKLKYADDLGHQQQQGVIHKPRGQNFGYFWPLRGHFY